MFILETKDKITAETTEQLIFNSDPFNTIQELTKSPVQTDVHIRVFKRNGKKCWTTLDISTLPEITANPKAFITKCSKKFSCGGSHDKDENIIKFTGDIRNGLAELLEENGLVQKENIKIHGY